MIEKNFLLSLEQFIQTVRGQNKTTLALLQHVIPQYLQCKTNREFLTDPRGAALAKV